MFTVNRKKSLIRVKRNTLRADSVHVEIELWGVIGKEPIMSPGDNVAKMNPKLINFSSSGNGSPVVLTYVSRVTAQATMSPEEFSVLIWSLPIVAQDELQLPKDVMDMIYANIVRTKKMFITMNGLTLI